MLKLVNQPEYNDFFYCDKDKYIVIKEGDNAYCLYVVGDRGVGYIRRTFSTIENLLRDTFSEENLQKLTYRNRPIFKEELELICGAVYKDYKNNLWLLTKHQNMYYCVYDNGVVQHGWAGLSEERMKEKAIDNSWVMLSDSFTKGKYDECK